MTKKRLDPIVLDNIPLGIKKNIVWKLRRTRFHVDSGDNIYKDGTPNGRRPPRYNPDEAIAHLIKKDGSYAIEAFIERITEADYRLLRKDSEEVLYRGN